MVAFRDEANCIHIKCNECDTEAPPQAEIMKKFGLNNMGWHCFGGTHLCPKHAPGKGK